MDADLLAELEATRVEMAGLREDMRGLRQSNDTRADIVRGQVRWLKVTVALLAAVVALAVAAGVRNEMQRNDQQSVSRCDLRSTILDIIDEAQASPEAAVAIIRRHDARFGTNRCGGVAVCADGTYSEAAGIQGACSGHGGVAEVLIERDDD